MPFISKPLLALNLLARVAAGLLSEVRPGVVLKQVQAMLADTIEVSTFHHYLVDADQPDWLVIESYGVISGMRSPPQRIAFGNLLCGMVARTESRLIIEDVQAHTDDLTAGVRGDGVGVYVGFPLLAQGQLLGTLAFCSHARTHLGRESLELLQVVCDLVAGRLHRDRLTQARRVAEATLRENLHQVRLALDAAGDVGTFVYDAIEDRLIGDARMASLYNLPLADVESGLPAGRFLEQVHPDDLARVTAIRALVSSDHPSYNNEYRVRGDEGAERWLEVRALRQFDADGRLQRVVGVVIDTTQRKQQELNLDRQVRERTEALAEALTRERLLIEHHPDVLWIARVQHHEGYGPDFFYESFNPGMRRQTGLIVEDMLGRTPHECFPADVADEMLSQFRACVRSGVPETYLETREFPAGLRHLETTLVPILGPDGRTEQLMGSARDITERMMLEEQRRQGQKFEAIGRLSAGVAHDFNNILQSVLGALDLLRDELASHDESVELVDIAIAAGRRGGQLTHHLLSYARQQMLLPRTVAIADVLDRLIPTLRRTLGPHVKIAFDRPDTSPSVHVDVAMFETAMINLAVNAEYAMPQGGTLRFSVATRRPPEGLLAETGPCAVLTIEDSGTGIAPEVLPRVFEPFFSTKGLEGSGLGLPMVQGFVRQSGGDVTLHSRPDCGTTVTLWFPLRGAVASNHAALPSTPASRRRARALLVDDDPDVLATTAAALGRDGLDVVSVCGGAAALDRLSDGETFDVLVTDYAMPDLNGIDLARGARARRPKLPVVLMTRFVDAVGRGPHDGFTVLSKPFHREQLMAAIQTATGQGPSAI